MPNPLTGADSWLYHLDDISAARAQEIGAASVDLAVIDQSTFAGDTLRDYTPTEIETMRGANNKLVVSYISIGEAETYRDYFLDDFLTSPPSWLDTINPNFTDNIKVRYWDPEWQAIVFDLVDEMVAQGFNGLYMDIIDAFEHFEETAPNAGIDYRAEMASFVTAIRDRADAKLAEIDPDRDFAIIGQNGVDLIDTPGYLAAIDGIGQEDLRFIYDDPDREQDFTRQPNADFNALLAHLTRAEAAGVEVFAVEYMTKARQTEFAADLQAELAALTARGIPLYLAEDRDLSEIYDQSAIGGAGEGEISGDGDDDRLIGGPGDERIKGLGGADLIKGGAGDDTLDGGQGDDRLIGQRGDDKLLGRAGDDDLRGGGGADLLKAGGGADNLRGGAGADTLKGGGGDDDLRGGGKADRLIAGGGSDDLRGQGGADTFVFKGRFGGDVIHDFDIAQDALEVKGAFEISAEDEGLFLDFGASGSILLKGLGEADAGDILFA